MNYKRLVKRLRQKPSKVFKSNQNEFINQQMFEEHDNICLSQ